MHRSVKVVSALSSSGGGPRTKVGSEARRRQRAPMSIAQTGGRWQLLKT